MVDQQSHLNPVSLRHEDSEMTDLSVSDFPLGQGKYYDIDRIFTRGTQFANEFEPSEDVRSLRVLTKDV